MRTYELKEVPKERIPVIGEIRFTLPLLPMPGEQLASMIHGNPERIVWDGTKWMASARTSTGSMKRSFDT